MKTTQHAFCFLLALFLFPALSEALVSNLAGDGGIVQVFLVRHAEKDTRVPMDPPLSPVGWERAQRLSHVLGSSGVTHLFSSDYARTQMTLTPLARSLGLPIALYNVREPAKLVKKLRALPLGSVAVVAGHSNTTPGLYQNLGGSKPKGLDERGFLSEKAYDRLFSVTLRVDGQATHFVSGYEQRYGETSSVERKGDYLGETLPTTDVRMFAPGWLSTGLAERDFAIGVDGDTIFTSITNRREATMVMIERKGGAWSAPAIAPFSGKYPDLEPAFDPRDGSLWFASKRPLPGETEAGDYNLWRVSRGESGWREPAPIEGLNGPGDEFYPSISKDGLVVFTATREGGQGGEDLWFAIETAGVWEIVNAGPSVNTTGPEFNACLNPDGTKLLFSSVRKGDEGGGDLYISELDAKGEWSAARALIRLNSPALDYCPSFSPDGSLVWFTSRRRSPSGAPLDYKDLRHRLQSNGNGLDDIYWAPVEMLEK
ncbi:MAG: hypothetical protein GY930_15570 [bacterium]|nr:hypothetical protein [bacterium]